MVSTRCVPSRLAIRMRKSADSNWAPRSVVIIGGTPNAAFERKRYIIVDHQIIKKAPIELLSEILLLDIILAQVSIILNNNSV